MGKYERVGAGTVSIKCTLWSWKKQRCRDGVMSGFVSWCRHLVPFFLHPYIPLHFIEMIFPLVSLIYHFEAKPQQNKNSLRRARGQRPLYKNVRCGLGETKM